MTNPHFLEFVEYITLLDVLYFILLTFCLYLSGLQYYCSDGCIVIGSPSSLRIFCFLYCWRTPSKIKALTVKNLQNHDTAMLANVIQHFPCIQILTLVDCEIYDMRLVRMALSSYCEVNVVTTEVVDGVVKKTCMSQIYTKPDVVAKGLEMKPEGFRV